MVLHSGKLIDILSLSYQYNTIIRMIIDNVILTNYTPATTVKSILCYGDYNSCSKELVIVVA